MGIAIINVPLHYFFSFQFKVLEELSTPVPIWPVQVNVQFYFSSAPPVKIYSWLLKTKRDMKNDIRPMENCCTCLYHKCTD